MTNDERAALVQRLTEGGLTTEAAHRYAAGAAAVRDDAPTDAEVERMVASAPSADCAPESERAQTAQLREVRQRVERERAAAAPANLDQRLATFAGRIDPELERRLGAF